MITDGDRQARMEMLRGCAEWAGYGEAYDLWYTWGMATSQWREQWAGRVRTPEDMVRFVDAVGCCASKPLTAYPDFPSQSEALGEIAVGTTDPWFWKDDLHAEKRLYYTRVFGGQPGFISTEMLPVLIATNGAVFDELVFDGLVSPEMQDIYRAIETHGPIPIRNLKRMLGPDGQRASTRVLHDLERQFIIAKTGITGRTRGTYGYIWDLAERWMPETLVAADGLGRPTAVAVIREHLAAFDVPPDSPFYVKVLGWAP